MAEEEATQQQQAPAAQAQILGAPPVIDDGTMDDLVDKLRLLNYETEFLPTGRPPFKPLTKTFFTTQGDNAQFFYMTSLVSWLMTQAGHTKFPPPDQYDDPNATSTNILQELKAMGLTTQNLPPNRVRQGHGDAVLTILSLLVDRALLSRGFAFRSVVFPASKAGDDDAASLAEQSSTALGGGGGDSDVDDNVDADSDSGDEVYVRRGFGGVKMAADDNEMIVPQVSAEVWQLEVERVGPSLQVRGDEVRDWRARIENASALLAAVEKMYPDVKTMLERLGEDLRKTQDLIQKREQSLSMRFSDHVREYREKLTDLNASQDAYNATSQNVGRLSQELNQISEQLEQAKNELQDRENRLSDPAPLMKIKESVQRIRGEIKEMSLRIGVLQHTTLHYALRQSAEKRKKQLRGTEDDSMMGGDGADTTGPGGASGNWA